MPDFIQNNLARVAPGSTAYTTGNDAFTPVAIPAGTHRIIVAGALDAAAFPIIRLNSTNINLNNGVALAASSGFVFEYVVSGQDCGTGGAANTGLTVRFSANGNILHLIVAYCYA